MVGEFLRTILSDTGRIVVDAVTYDGAAGTEAAVRYQPDVVLMDLRMPQVDGIAATAEIRSLPQPPAVLAMTTVDTDEQVLAALARSAATGALTDPDVQLAEPAQLPLHVGKVQAASLVDPEADLRHQLRGDEVPGGRRELAAGHQLSAPAGEQGGDLGVGRRNAKRGLLATTGLVHLVDRAFDNPAGQGMDLDLVPQLQEREERRHRLRPRQPSALRGGPQHLAEVGVGVSGFHVPQGFPEPGPHLFEVADIGADCAIGQPGRGTGEHEPGQHVGLELRQLLRTRRRPPLAEIPHNRQTQPAAPPSVLSAHPRPVRDRFTEAEVESERQMITRRSGNALVLGGSDPRVPDEEPQNSRVISY
ncbi:response regulator transcription factor [Amycolatopsis sp. cmx-11-32]|uniref:response regulator n=1 Tax=Amycolatopsis sp. cmx-11-32 TaxID=2785796 RepID=UPI0039E507FE